MQYERTIKTLEKAMTLSEIYDRLNTMEASYFSFDVRNELMELTRIVSDMREDMGYLTRKVERLRSSSMVYADGKTHLPGEQL